jgi:hypothetical protein
MKKILSSDPDIVGSFPALRRAARAARKLGEQTGTPVYVLEGGRVVNINPVPSKQTNGRARKRNGKRPATYSD